MPTKEEEFKQRFVAVLQDLQENGKNDIEAMWLLGSLAAALVDKAGKTSWAELKRTISQQDYSRLLTDFQTEGNRQHREGDVKKAYAIQILGISLITVTQTDPQLAAGAALLDEIIQTTILIYRKNRDVERPTVN
jgi:hypothetical protein